MDDLVLFRLVDDFVERVKVEASREVAPAVDLVFVREGVVAVAFGDDTVDDLLVEVFDQRGCRSILYSILLQQVIDQTFLPRHSKLSVRSQTPRVHLALDREHDVVVVAYCDLLNLVDRVGEDDRHGLCTE